MDRMERGAAEFSIESNPRFGIGSRFHKTRDHEAARIERALKAQKRCEATHDKADTVWTR